MGSLALLNAEAPECCSCGSGAACYLPGGPQLPGGAGGANWPLGKSHEGGQWGLGAALAAGAMGAM